MEIKKTIIFEKDEEHDAEELFRTLAAELGYELDAQETKPKKPRKKRVPKAKGELKPHVQDSIAALRETRKEKELDAHKKRGSTWCLVCKKHIPNKLISKHREAHELRGE